MIYNILLLPFLFLFPLFSFAENNYETDYRIASNNYNIDENLIRSFATYFSGEEKYFISVFSHGFHFKNSIEASNFLDTIQKNRWMLIIFKGSFSFNTVSYRNFFYSKNQAIDWINGFNSDYGFYLKKIDLKKDVKIGIMGVPFLSGVEYEDIFNIKNNISLGTQKLKFNISNYGLENGINLYSPSNSTQAYDKVSELYKGFTGKELK